MSASASTVSPPPPSSPGRSSSSAMATPSTVIADTPRRSRPSFVIGYSHPPLGSTPSVSPSSSTGPSASRPPYSSTSASTSNTHSAISAAQTSKPFVAPAHPQSHHLHTLPPREKTTRTLILDHTAWLHGRTRFAQGRSELGMKVRLKPVGVTADIPDVRNSHTGGRAGFYIGSGSGSGRADPFGDPLEVELASSDDEDEDDDEKESDSEGLQALGYGGRLGDLQTRKMPRKESNVEDKSERMDLDESDFGGDSDDEPSTARGLSCDPSVAPLLAARAIGIEKVLHAMLTQPPSSPPRSPSPPPYALHSAHAQSQHYRAPPPMQATSPSQAAGANTKPPLRLPNGLRLRLALLALVNDLFERQPSPTSDEPLKVDVSSTPSQTTGPSANPGSSTDPTKATSNQSLLSSLPPLPPPSIPAPDALPPGLTALAQVSSQPFNVRPTLPSFQTLTLPSSSVSGLPTSALSPSSGTGSAFNASTSSTLGGAASDKDSPMQTRRPPPPLFAWTRTSTDSTSPTSPVPASPLSSTPFSPSSSEKQSDKVSASSPSSFSRPSGPLLVAPRSLPSSWKGSTPRYHPSSKSVSSGSASNLARRAVGRVKDLYSAGCYAAPGSVPTNTYRSNVRTFGTGTPPVVAPGYPIEKLKTLCPRHLAEKCGICASGTVSRGGPSTRIGAGLLKMERGLLTCAVRGDDKKSGGILADMIPRFLRLSALVAMELGREASGEEIDMADVQSHDTASINSNLSAKASLHAQPTREWYALLCGLLTRAVLEGYVARAWKGPEYVEVLMGIGLGIRGVGTRKSSTGFGGNKAGMPQPGPTVEEEDAGEFEPDEMPGLVEACKVLFSGLVLDALAPDVKEKATQATEEEYVAEMQERMSEFFTIPHTTPDLGTHLTQLSSKYPAEPVERAALRFCEAVAKWRGKPELESYKRTTSHRCSQSKSQSSTPVPLSIHALVTSTPTPTPSRPPIDKYFRIPPLPPRQSAEAHKSLKRQRSIDQEEREPKKEKVEPVDIDLSKTQSEEPDRDSDVMQEWVGPYGV